jgi:hypothetical protein
MSRWGASPITGIPASLSDSVTHISIIQPSYSIAHLPSFASEWRKIDVLVCACSLEDPIPVKPSLASLRVLFVCCIPAHPFFLVAHVRAPLCLLKALLPKHGSIVTAHLVHSKLDSGYLAAPYFPHHVRTLVVEGSNAADDLLAMGNLVRDFIGEQLVFVGGVWTIKVTILSDMFTVCMSDTSL